MNDTFSLPEIQKTGSVNAHSIMKQNNLNKMANSWQSNLSSQN